MNVECLLFNLERKQTRIWRHGENEIPCCVLQGFLPFIEYAIEQKTRMVFSGPVARTHLGWFVRKCCFQVGFMVEEQTLFKWCCESVACQRLPKRAASARGYENERLWGRGGRVHQGDRDNIPQHTLIILPKAPAIGYDGVCMGEYVYVLQAWRVAWDLMKHKTFWITTVEKSWHPHCWRLQVGQ